MSVAYFLLTYGVLEALVTVTCERNALPRTAQRSTAWWQYSTFKSPKRPDKFVSGYSHSHAAIQRELESG